MSENKNTIDQYSTSTQAVKKIIEEAAVIRAEDLMIDGVRVGGKVVAVIVRAGEFWPATVTDTVLSDAGSALSRSGKFEHVNRTSGMLIVTKKV